MPGEGVRLAAISAGDPAAPPIVLVHGYPDTKELWRPVIDKLAQEFHVIAYDVRGAGGSSAPRGPAAYRLPRLADDFASVCATLAGDRPVHLVGHDWGGIQGWAFACDPRFTGRIASFTTIAGPALPHAKAAIRRPLRNGHPLRGLDRARRSWYIVPLCVPGGPTLTWRRVLRGDRFRAALRHIEGVAIDDSWPASTAPADGLHGANLYRANIALRAGRPDPIAPAVCPVQVVVPSGDRFISSSYYDAAERAAPGHWRRTIATTHWAPRAAPDLIARWVGELVHETEPADGGAGPGAGRVPTPRRRWVRGGGAQQLGGALALVTGAGSGIGRATAARLADHGAQVLLVDRDEATVTAAAEQCNGTPLVCDVSDPEAMAALAARTLAEHGVPDVLINNAGIAVAGRFVDTSESDWRDIVDVNLMGVVHGCRLFAPAMIQRGLGGQIVNTASVAAFTPSRTLGAYATTKAAVLMLSESLRAELGDHGIGVTAICPGLIATNITKAARYVGDVDSGAIAERVTKLYERRNFTPDRVAAEIVYAIATDQPVALVTPETRLLRGLSRLSPGLMRWLARQDPPGV